MEIPWSVVGYVFLGALWIVLAIVGETTLLFRTFRIAAGALFFLLAVFIYKTGQHPIRSKFGWKE